MNSSKRSRPTGRSAEHPRRLADDRGSVCAAVNCMDGRVQVPVRDYVRSHFAVDQVDMITEPGPAAFLSIRPGHPTSRSILTRLDLSVRAHAAKGIVVVAHHDCTGNPVSEAEQHRHLELATRFIAQRYRNLAVLGLWVTASWNVVQVCSMVPSATPARAAARARSSTGAR